MRARFTEVDRRRVAHAQAWKCAGCKELLPYTFQIDHRVALGMGGEDTLKNCQALCNDCHASKTVADVRRANAIRVWSRGGKMKEVYCAHCDCYYSMFFAEAHLDCF